MWLSVFHQIFSQQMVIPGKQMLTLLINIKYGNLVADVKTEIIVKR
jgi:hypothetical protein